MAKSKTQNSGYELSLFSVFDYYDEKGELQNDVLNPNNRYRDQRANRELFQRQGATSGTLRDSQRELSSKSSATGSIPSQSESGGIQWIRRNEHTRGNMGDRSKQTRKEVATDSSQSTNGVLFQSQDMDDNRERMANSGAIPQSTSGGKSRLRYTERIPSSVDNGYSNEVGKTSLSKSNTNSRLRQIDLFSGETAGSRDRGVYESLFATEHSGIDSISSVEDNGGKPQSILPSVAGAAIQAKSTPQQYMGHSSGRTQTESSGGDLLENQTSSSDKSTAQIIPHFATARKIGETPSIIGDETYIPIGENYKLASDVSIKGFRDRFEANIAAISTLRELQFKGEMPNEEQKEILSKFSGFGGMAKIINGKDGDYAKEYEILANVVSDKKELDRLERSCTDAYYTPRFIIDSIYSSLNHFGLNNDSNTKHIYEPSCGNGRFIGYMPDANYKIHGTELDSTTFNIAKLLYPQANLENKAFERVDFNRNFDAFIGNPPYGDKDTGNENGEFKAYEIKSDSKKVESSNTQTKQNPQQVALEKAFWDNFDNLFNSGAGESIFFKYRGLTIGGSFSNDMKGFSFYIADSKNNYIEPDNLAYRINTSNILENDFRSVIKFNGLWARINNFFSNIYEHIQSQEVKLLKNTEIIEYLSEQIKHNEYPNATYLDALRRDNNQIIKEIQKMSQQKGYVSTFAPKSFEIKAANETARKIQVEK